MFTDSVLPQFAVLAGRMLFAGLLWIMFIIPPAAAHEIRPAVVDVLLQDDGRFTASLRLNLEALLAGIGTAHKDSDESDNAPIYDRLRGLSPAQLASEFAGFEAEFLAAVALEFDGRRQSVEVGGVSIPPVGDTDLARDSIVTLSGAIPGDAKSLTWRWDERFGAVIVRADSASAGELYSAYLQPGDSSDDIDLQGLVKQSSWQVFRNYVAIGFEHIVPKGADHILFVVGLFLLSPSWRVLLWQVSAFTLAHTITLALSMLGWVQLPAMIVEPLIAASIIYICVENLFYQRLTRWRPVVVFCFGLLHGLGFAGVLTEIGLSQGNFLTGLIAFNIGVELGQLAVLTLCFLLVGIWFRHRAWYRRVVTIPASLLIAFVGSYWLVERTLLV